MDLPDRFFDADQEFLHNVPPMMDYRNQSLVKIEEAIDKLQIPRQSIDHMMKWAKRKTFRLKYDLTADEAAAIYLYTMRHSEPARDISVQLNKALRLRFRQMLTSWYPYLQLLITALNKLPSTKGTIWRYGRGHVFDNYRKDCTWLGFSSCAGTKPFLEQSFNKFDVYSIFKIECTSGKLIREFSEFPWDNEVLLLPDTYLRVIKKTHLKNTLTIIHLQEQSCPHISILPTLKFSSSLNQNGTPNHGFTSTRSQLIDETVSVQESNTPKLPLIKSSSPSHTHRLVASPVDKKQPSKNTKDNVSPNVNVETHEHKNQYFPIDKPWLNLNFRDNNKRLIVPPADLEMKLQDPPKITNSVLLNRVKGSMFGMALGDALAVHARFRSHQDLMEHPVQEFQEGGRWNLKKGQFADDTSMGLCLASSLVVRRDFIPYDQLVRYKWWFRHGYMSSTGQCFTISSIMTQSLKEFERRQQLFASKYNISTIELDTLFDLHLLERFDTQCSNNSTGGNEALMRLTPVPLFFYRHPIDAIEFSGISGAITHGESAAYDTCRYFGALIVAILHGETKQQLLDDNFYLNHKSWFNNKALGPDIMRISQGSYKKIGRNSDGIKSQQRIVDALEAALWAFYFDDDSFEKGILNAINLGDDTDTTAAIYAPLAGAYYGFDNLPKKWTSQVYARNLITCISKWIVYEGEFWQPKFLIPNRFEPKPQSRLMTFMPMIETEHTRAPDLTLDEFISGRSKFKEVVRPSLMATYENSLERQITPGLYSYGDRTTDINNRFLNPTYNVRLSTSTHSTPRYRPSDSTGFHHGNNVLASENFLLENNTSNSLFPFLSDWSHGWHPSISTTSMPYFYSGTLDFHDFD